jgi:hypothetical protein
MDSISSILKLKDSILYPTVSIGYLNSIEKEFNTIWGDELSMRPHTEIEYGKMWLFTEMGILKC